MHNKLITYIIMKTNKLLTLLLLLVMGAGITLNAQTAVTVGSQVTSESQLGSGQAYVLQSQASGTGTLPYINDNGTDYDIPMNNACNGSSVYYLISNGDGTWKIKNYYTNHFWGVPVYNEALSSATDEASAGAWSLNFSNGTAYPTAPDADGTARGLDRSSNKLLGYSTGTAGTKQVKIYEVSADAVTLTFDRSGAEVSTVTVNIVDGSGNPIPGITATLESTSFGNFKTGTAEALTRTTNSVLAPANYENAGASMSYTFKITGLSSAFSFNTASADVYAMNEGGTAQSNTNRYFAFDLSIGSTEAGVSTFSSRQMVA